uniref:Neuropeptide Y prohormone-7 n=1 Tax=Schmidtea mediterranea TaxID=79327 RepID=E3CTJ5_SCHMD|nr:TPA_inf: neuropeptide Y prohormone-7 [Schmidtea mediterranea]
MFERIRNSIFLLFISLNWCEAQYPIFGKMLDSIPFKSRTPIAGIVNKMGQIRKLSEREIKLLVYLLNEHFAIYGRPRYG